MSNDYQFPLHLVARDTHPTHHHQITHNYTLSLITFIYSRKTFANMFKTPHIPLTNHSHYKILVTADYLHYTTRVNKLSQLYNPTQTNPGWSRLNPPPPTRRHYRHEPKREVRGKNCPYYLSNGWNYSEQEAGG